MAHPSRGSAGEPNSPSLSSRIESLLRGADKVQENRRLRTERTMEDLDRRLKHVAYLVADLNLRYVIPKLRELGAMFQKSMEPKKEGLCDRVCLDFLPSAEYPAQARVSIGMAPDPPAEHLRVTVSVMLVPVYLDYDREAWLDLRVENPDTKALEEFLDQRLLQFVKDYLRVRDAESPYHEDQKVTDPVCKMTFPATDAASFITHKDRTYYFCVEGCRRKFEAAPERYIAHAASMKELPGQETSPLLEATPAEGGKRR